MQVLKWKFSVYFGKLNQTTYQMISFQKNLRPLKLKTTNQPEEQLVF